MIKCRKCSEKVQEGKYCSNCGAKLVISDYARYMELSTRINEKMCNEKSQRIYRRCFELVKMIYPKVVDKKHCSDEDKNDVIEWTNDLYTVVMDFKKEKSAKAATNADKN